MLDFLARTEREVRELCGHRLSAARSQLGSGIAMGNASCEVQRAARFVTASNDDEGFAKAVERFVLG